jgi:hypothetical protein
MTVARATRETAVCAAPPPRRIIARMNNQEWPDALDALIAAPQNHSLLLENDAVRVLDTIIHPGHTTPLHTHKWPATLYVLSWSDFLRRDAAGSVFLDSRTVQKLPVGSALWTPPLPPHTLENIGPSDLHVISVELKSA